MAKAHSAALHDKTTINKLLCDAEERQLAADEDKRSRQQHVSRLEATLEQQRQSIKSTEARLQADAADAMQQKQQHCAAELERVTRELGGNSQNVSFA